MKRVLFVLLAICIASVAFAAGGAQSTEANWPTRPIEIFFPANPGTATEMTLRAIVPYLEKQLGVAITVQSDGAAAGTISLNRIANARPDGYTWGYWTTVWVANRCFGDVLKGRIDPVTDYVWAGGNFADKITVMTRRNGPYQTMADIINAAKDKPNTVTFVRSAPGDVTSANIDYLQESQNVTFNIINGMDGGESIAAIMGGHVDVYVDNVSTSKQLYKDGSVMIAGIGGAERDSDLPEIATFNEQGYAGWPVQTSERHFYGPAGIPQEIANKFREALKKASEDPEYIASLKNLGLDHFYADADESLRQITIYADAFRANAGN